nr:MAG TPA: hypothetical protein [Caudoviricetes sp.]
MTASKNMINLDTWTPPNCYQYRKGNERYYNI